MKSAVIIGGTRGIGAGIAAALKAKGWAITATGVSREEVDAYAAAEPEAATAILAFEPAEEVTGLARALAELEGTVDCPERRALVLSVGRLGDPRALPVLDRHRRRRCGRRLDRVVDRARRLLERAQE